MQQKAVYVICFLFCKPESFLEVTFKPSNLRMVNLNPRATCSIHYLWCLLYILCPYISISLSYYSQKRIQIMFILLRSFQMIVIITATVTYGEQPSPHPSPQFSLQSITNTNLYDYGTW